ncbi:hypothetical protein MRB53_003186 [Persea americana]|uniref:Uncharacterized protein n=1 Tax=Persea americana TaxID=3435 RepID=A0ACC2MXB0_PERAE|nr:hypothetical protein MRB53_003186 [Persea americana]
MCSFSVVGATNVGAHQICAVTVVHDVLCCTWCVQQCNARGVCSSRAMLLAECMQCCGGCERRRSYAARAVSDDVQVLRVVQGRRAGAACAHVEGTVGAVWYAFPQTVAGWLGSDVATTWAGGLRNCHSSLVCELCWACGELCGPTVAWQVACNHSDKLHNRGLFSSKALATVEGPSWQAVSLGGTV